MLGMDGQQGADQLPVLVQLVADDLVAPRAFGAASVSASASSGKRQPVHFLSALAAFRTRTTYANVDVGLLVHLYRLGLEELVNRSCLSGEVLAMGLAVPT